MCTINVPPVQTYFEYFSTYTIRKVNNRVFFRPTLSATGPKISDPNITPAKKMLIDNGESQDLSQTNDHSEICKIKYFCTQFEVHELLIIEMIFSNAKFY